jgi:predicted transcriptional regulator
MLSGSTRRQEGKPDQVESLHGKLAVIRKILESTQGSGGAPEPRLMYGSYLSYVQIDEYLSLMMTNGLLRYDRETRKYRITARGMDFLASIRQMDYSMKAIEDQ